MQAGGATGDDKDLSQPVSHMGLTQPCLECGKGWGWAEGASADGEEGGWGFLDFAEDA